MTRHTVLLVDDDAQLLQGLTRALRREPYEIVQANSAKDALGTLASREIGVIVSDEGMPDMSGHELLARVHARHPDTMRIILTGNGSLEVAMRAINEGQVCRFFTKPCNVVELGVAIRQALQQRELVLESRRLLQMLRRQSAVMDELEGEVRGLTAIQRDASGAIVIPDAPTDLDALLKEAEAELLAADERLRRRAAGISTTR